MKSAMVSLSVILMLSCTGVRKESAPDRRTHVKIALTNVPLPYIPAILAQQLGFYQQRGLNVEIEDFTTASQVLHAVLAGSADVAAGTFEQAVQLGAEGQHIKAFLLFVQQASRVIVAVPTSRKRLRDIRDLKGKVVGVAGLGSANHLFLNYVLLQNGMKLTDVTTVAIGVGATAVAALEQKRVDAAVLVGSEPDIAFNRIPGLTMLLDVRGPENCKKVFNTENYPGAALVSSERWLKKNPETASRMAKATQAGLRWIKDHSPEEILSRLPANYRMPDHEAEIKALTRFLPGFSPDGVMSREGAEAAKRMVAASIESVRNSTVDVSQTYTNEFLVR
jgi:NitT/TauT family transport system substrate-binding protein